MGKIALHRIQGGKSSQARLSKQPKSTEARIPPPKLSLYNLFICLTFHGHSLHLFGDTKISLVFENYKSKKK